LHSRYRFKGSAYAASGVITTPFRELIEVQAPATLAEFGGVGSSKVSCFKHRDILHFEHAHSEVTGSRTCLDQPGETYSTLVRSTVEGLNVLGMVTAYRVVAHLVTTYRPGSGAENSVKLIGSHFENLKIAGCRVHVDLCVGVLDKYHHHKDLKAAYGTDKKVRDLFGDDELRQKHHQAPQEVKNFLAAPTSDSPEMPANSDGVSRLSIVKKVSADSDAIECYGHVIHIEGFGTIRLGELHICKHTRNLTMIHIHLGCPYEGDVGITSTAGGGSDN